MLENAIRKVFQSARADREGRALGSRQPSKTVFQRALKIVNVSESSDGDIGLEERLRRSSSARGD